MHTRKSERVRFRPAAPSLASVCGRSWRERPPASTSPRVSRCRSGADLVPRQEAFPGPSRRARGGEEDGCRPGQSWGEPLAAGAAGSCSALGPVPGQKPRSAPHLSAPSPPRGQGDLPRAGGPRGSRAQQVARGVSRPELAPRASLRQALHRAPRTRLSLPTRSPPPGVQRSGSGVPSANPPPPPRLRSGPSRPAEAEPPALPPPATPFRTPQPRGWGWPGCGLGASTPRKAARRRGLRAPAPGAALAACRARRGRLQHAGQRQGGAGGPRGGSCPRRP